MEVLGMNMGITGINGAQQSGGMQHSDSMHRSHHSNPTNEGKVSVNVDRFEKSQEFEQLTLYNEKGEIIKY